MKVSTILALLLFLLMALIGKKKGIKSFAALFFNFIIISASILLICLHVSVFLLIAPDFLLILIVNLFFINHWNPKTICAFAATALTLIIVTGFIYLIVKYAMIQGFGEEEEDTISGYSLSLGIRFKDISIYIIAISSIGAMIDVAMSISSALYELFQLQPRSDIKKLRQSGFKIGRDILGTTTNTLYFALIGGYLTLVIWFKTQAYTFSAILNSKVFAAELLSLLAGAIGVVLVIPATAVLCSLFYRRTFGEGETFPQQCGEEGQETQSGGQS